MKKLFFSLILVLTSISAFAQDDVSYYVVRNGNTYIAEGMTMNKKEFLGFLQSRDAINYSTFQSGYKLSNVGWGLFGGGLLLECIGIPFLWTNYNTNLGYTFTVTGDLINTAGIICLAVGYARMHNTVNSYNTMTASRRNQQPAVAFALQSSRDGIGLAIQF